MIGKGYLVNILSVIVITIFPFNIVDKPLLIGKPVAKMIDYKWKYIVQRFHGPVINAFACLLEPHKLKDTITLIGYFFPSFVTASISGSAKFVSMDRGASVIFRM